MNFIVQKGQFATNKKEIFSLWPTSIVDILSSTINNVSKHFNICCLSLLQKPSSTRETNSVYQLITLIQCLKTKLDALDSNLWVNLLMNTDLSGTRDFGLNSKSPLNPWSKI